MAGREVVVRPWASDRRVILLVLILSSYALAGSTGNSRAASLSGSASTHDMVEVDWVPVCIEPDINNLPPQCTFTTTQAYVLYLRNGSYQQPWELVDTITNTLVTHYTVIGLQPDTSYQLKVVEQGGCSSGWFSSGCQLFLESNVLTVHTPPLPPPPGTGADPGTGNLFWLTVGPALLSVVVAGVSAGLLLAFRVQLGDWLRRRREQRVNR